MNIRIAIAVYAVGVVIRVIGSGAGVVRLLS
jgi:hypothetical protein